MLLKVEKQLRNIFKYFTIYSILL